MDNRLTVPRGESTEVFVITESESDGRCILLPGMKIHSGNYK